MNDTELKVSEEQAEAEFAKFIDEMEIDADTDKMDEEDKKSFELQKSRIIKAMCVGRLVFNDSMEPIYTTREGASLTFRQPSGASLMAMDKRKKNEDFAKMFNSMADIAGTTPKTFAMMKMPDLKVCQAITALFLA